MIYKNSMIWDLKLLKLSKTQQLNKKNYLIKKKFYFYKNKIKNFYIYEPGTISRNGPESLP